MAKRKPRHEPPLADTAVLMSQLLLCDVEVATLLRVTPSAVQELHRLRLLPGAKCGRCLRWRPADVAAFVSNLNVEHSQ
ncbi:MAG: helix-turn-helix domain-containing protein [bacterium]|nr:helix-turn-helix domain-containing protein [bacterium]